MSDRPPVFLLYPEMWPSLTCESRQDTISRGSEPVLAAAHTLRVGEVKAIADVLAEEHQAKMAAAREAVVSSFPEAQSCARMED